ncbi:hypothetical protein [Albidovulum sediminis]|uniref:Uncharacterized protein n=1 Tax=Albidovulum sediminis TaxID=3066345 RepID=A0ABT2NU22_9RHOB|nr:hypothetical protein [Defluviimonas sediminis]MCT8331424.1 hypothetical protein [Defluviimonas sediminis]
MKNLVLSALLLGLAAPAAFAYSADGQTLPSTDRAEIKRIVPNANLDNLTADQAAALGAALYSGDQSERAGSIRAILN